LEENFIFCSIFLCQGLAVDQTDKPPLIHHYREQATCPWGCFARSRGTGRVWLSSVCAVQGAA